MSAACVLCTEILKINRRMRTMPDTQAVEPVVVTVVLNIC